LAGRRGWRWSPSFWLSYLAGSGALCSKLCGGCACGLFTVCQGAGGRLARHPCRTWCSRCQASGFVPGRLCRAVAGQVGAVFRPVAGPSGVRSSSRSKTDEVLLLSVVCAFFLVILPHAMGTVNCRPHLLSCLSVYHRFRAQILQYLTQLWGIVLFIALFSETANWSRAEPWLILISVLHSLLPFVPAGWLSVCGPLRCAVHCGGGRLRSGPNHSLSAGLLRRRERRA